MILYGTGGWHRRRSKQVKTCMSFFQALRLRWTLCLFAMVLFRSRVNEYCELVERTLVALWSCILGLLVGVLAMG